TFTHDMSEYKLTGEHLYVECAKCHPKRRYKNIDETCYSCHISDDEKIHDGELGKVCEDCHTVYGWAPSTFDIERHNLLDFKLTGEHAGAKCQKCHTEGRYKNLDATCIACHRKDDEREGHNGQLGEDCQRCHTVLSWNDDTFTHDMSEYKLTGEHLYVECAKCHPKRRYKNIDKTCYSCHISDDKKAHDGELGRDCENCHSTEGWKPSTYVHSEREIERVEKSRWRPLLAWLLPERITPKNKIIAYRYELKGKHAGLKCEQCHKDNRYKAAEPDCVSCHAKNDKHVKELGRDCERCHTTNGWDVISFDHQLSAFPLRGEHARLSCNSCHQSNQYKETSSRCQHCHAGSVSHANDINSDCETCHTSEFSWQVITFDHNQSRFPLRQKHKTATCWDCHSEDTFEGLSKECFTCHEDVHNGEFGYRCEVCHSEMVWKPASFNHSLTGFLLTGKHIATDCADCHPNGSYQGTPKDCYSCHRQDTPDAHYGIACDDCHTTSNWGGAQFKHTEFLIIGKHRKADCVDCHPVGDFYKEFTCIGGGCHPKDKMDKKHRNKRGYVYDSIACFNCHPTGKKEEHEDD
ncbi:MAG: cytochrome c3 family protein, partial [Candidatus Poribacteria bacterium]